MRSSISVEEEGGSYKGREREREKGLVQKGDVVVEEYYLFCKIKQQQFNSNNTK